MIEPKCTETKKTVKRFVTETVSLKYLLQRAFISFPFQVCELIPTPKCQMTPCPVDATFVGREQIIVIKKHHRDAIHCPYLLHSLHLRTLGSLLLFGGVLKNVATG